MKKLSQHISACTIVIAATITFISCKKATTPPIPSTIGGAKYENGLFISNEGSFGFGNGSISFYNSASNSVKNSIFSIENNRPLGDVVQSISRIGSSAYICVNGSNKIEVVDALTFKEQATITGVSLPRYIISNGNTGYVSSWANGGEVVMVDLVSNSVTGSIPVGAGPEKMAISNNYLYVANSGGYGLDSTISVIDLVSNTVTTTININGYNPSAIVNGNGNTIWVIARGQVIYDANWNVVGHDPSKLVEINTSTNTVSGTTALFASDHPSNIDISPDKNTLYLGGSYGFPAIYTINPSAPSAPLPLISEVNYGFFVNQSNGNIFVLQEASSSNGKLLRYTPSGSKLGEYTVGVFPNGGVNRINR